jgi:GNAT superfamily N-acetyltransferase
MLSRPIHHRRARRTDFDAVGAILQASAAPTPPRDRAGLHRFRRVVADLGADLYVAEADGRVLGIVHISYVRHVNRPPEARIELLVVDPPMRRQGVGRGLLVLAAARARRHGCVALRCSVAPAAEMQAFFTRVGWQGGGDEFQFDLADPAQ